MKIENLYPFWKNLTDAEKRVVEQAVFKESYSKGMLMHRTEDSCKGLITVLSGQLRTYIVSEEGREVTLFRVNAEEVCVLSASCLMDTITFDVLIEATEETEVENILHINIASAESAGRIVFVQECDREIFRCDVDDAADFVFEN